MIIPNIELVMICSLVVHTLEVGMSAHILFRFVPQGKANIIFALVINTTCRMTCAEVCLQSLHCLFFCGVHVYVIVQQVHCGVLR